MRRIISFFVIVLLLCNIWIIPTEAVSNYKHGYTAISVGETHQKYMTGGATQKYCFTATADQYYSFYFANQSLEVRSGIGFVDGFLNLFVGKLSVTIYDEWETKLTTFEVRCGYETTSSLQLKKDQSYYFDVSSSVDGNYRMRVSMLSDIGGNTWDQATGVLPTHQIISAIDTSGDKDWFKFTTDGDLSFYNYSLENIQGDSSLYFYLYEYVPGAGDTPLRDVTNFYVGSNSRNSKNIKLKQNAVYYFCIQMPYGNKGGYVLDSTQRIDSCGDTKETSYSADLQKTYITSFDGINDIDFYRFTTADYDAYYHFSFNKLNNSHETVDIKLYDENNNEIFSEFIGTYGSSLTKSVKLNKNSVYYVRLFSSAGNYDFTINVNKDNEGNTKEEAYNIPLNFRYTTTFDGTYDIDFYRFTTADYDAYYHFSFNKLNNSHETVDIKLYDENNNEIFSEFIGTYGSSLTKSVKLNKNSVYYVRLFSSTGNYDFTINVNKDNEGDTKEKALSIDINKVIECNFEASDDLDWFKVDISNDGNYRLIIVNESCYYAPYIYLYNNRNRELVSTYNSATIWLDAGTYYLRTAPRNSSAGYYSIVLANCGTGHSETSKYRPAGYNTDGTRIVYCKCCQQEIRKEPVKGIASVSLKTTSLVYSGNNLRPTVIAKNTDGKIISSYDLTYSDSKSIKTGTYKVTVTFKGAYNYEKALIYRIVPKLSSTSKVIYIGETFKLKASGGSNYTYKSGKTSVATINSKGVITAKREGTATISVTTNGVSGTCKITVKKPVIKLNKSSVTLRKGKKIVLKATIKPSGKVNWKSSNKKIATVSSKGVVTAKKSGKATITCSYSYKGKAYQKTCKIRVK